MEQDKLQSIIESLLFINGEPIKKSKLVRILDEKSENVEKALSGLSEKYEKSAGGLMLLKKGEEVQLVSNPENAGYVEKLIKSELQDSLSNAALEVISIVAYKGPVLKSEIEAIRGVNCSYTLRNLLLRGLVERNDNPRGSRGYVYSISFDFLKKLGIDDVKKMPQYDILSTDEKINSIIFNE
jgi:segregation and condensation protein B